MRLIALISFLFLPFLLSAQTTNRFKTVGSAIPLSDSCFRMTPALVNQSGSVWYDTRIDLRQNFTVECEINLGGLDQAGADGIAFVLQPLSSDLGSTGGGIGYAGINPSIAVEFDTYQNDDPPYDHIALVRDGQTEHVKYPSSTLVGPLEMLPGGANAEDLVSRPAKFTWDAATKRFQCYYDGVLKIDITIDLINTIFRGNPYVFWGFTAATGGFYNDQRVCFKNYTFVEECPTAKITGKNPICIGDTLKLKASGGKSFSWTGPNNFRSTDSVISILNASAIHAGTYQLIAVDSICIDTATLDVVVKPRTIASIATNSPLCEGDTLRLTGSGGTSYAWTGPSNFSASTAQVLIINTSVANAGNYQLIADNGACKDTATSNVIIRRSPQVESKDTLVEPRTVLDLVLRTTNDVTTYAWSPPDQLSCTTCAVPTATLLKDGSYTLKVTNTEGCTAEGSYKILFKCDVKNIFFANAFTPNGDGLNDYFYPMGSGIRQVIRMRIFSRWGEKVYEKKNFPANDRNYAWDGRTKGKDEGTSLFTYTATIECSEGQIIEMKGTITVIR